MTSYQSSSWVPPDDAAPFLVVTYRIRDWRWLWLRKTVKTRVLSLA